MTSRMACVALLLSALMLLGSVFLVGYANGVMDAALMVAQEEAADG